MNKETYFPKELSKETKDLVSVRIMAGKEYKEKYGSIKDLKHYQDFMKKREKELLND
jgi:hypothetical protein